MKLAIDISVVSNKQLAAVVWVLTAVYCVAGWPWLSPLERLVFAAIGGTAGAALVAKRFWLVHHHADAVMLQLHETLEMSGVEHLVSDRSISIAMTGTIAHVWGRGGGSIVSFNVRDPHSNKERFLVEVMTKYLRFIKRKDANGSG